MEFLGLNSQVEVDDWLIPVGEISRKRLIKRTANYNIYKADWFGDVLVYEPTGNERPTKGAEQEPLEVLSCQDLTSTRLMKVNLKLSKSSVQQVEEECSWSSSDSAYSSLSSTPEFHHRNEFEFPSASTEPQSSISELSNRLADLGAPPRGDSDTLVSVVLNRDSWCAGCNRSTDSNPSLFELNELRLVAHEGFMLFMGASIEEFRERQTQTSLVIQMNHPSTISLHELLYKAPSRPGNSSPNSRSPAANFLLRCAARTPAAERELTLEAKLNICQQVTNAMTYLHDKNIVHAKLSSVNIYIELNQRVKISMIDHDENALTLTNGAHTNINNNTAHQPIRFNLPALTYLSPELVRSLKLTRAKSNHRSQQNLGRHHLSTCDNRQLRQVSLDGHKFSKKSDIFSFGTLLFELFEQRYPFASQAQQLSGHQSPLTTSSAPLFKQTATNGNINISASQLIYQIGSGLIGSKNLSPIAGSDLGAVAQIISACWSTNPDDRPQFKQLTFV